MSFRFWYTNNDAVDLGSPFVVLAAFSEMAEVANEDWPSLYGVVHTDDQDLDRDYVADVQSEARDFLNKYRDDLGKDAIEILEALNGEIPWS
jgi:hypothetical protein